MVCYICLAKCSIRFPVRSYLMSDFRVLVKLENDLGFDEELDWDGKKKKWTLSDRESGLGHSWTEDMPVQSHQLDNLLEFFRITNQEIHVDVLVHLSPGELTLLHQATNSPATVFAYLCDKCQHHWYIFRWEFNENRWGVYGRTCDFSWRRGQTPSEEEITWLQKARGLENDGLKPLK